MKHPRPTPSHSRWRPARRRSGLALGLWLALIALALGVAASHSACVVGADCKYDTDCPLDSLCKAGRCDIKPDGGIKTGCSTDTDCPNTHLCIQRACKPISSLFDGKTTDNQGDGGPPTDRPGTDTLAPDSPPSESSPETTPDGPAPPPPLGPTPLQHAITSGGAISSNKTFRHVAVIGQACPVAPSSTVTRSTNYSARVGVMAVTLW